jgi:hypothetical protein
MGYKGWSVGNSQTLLLVDKEAPFENNTWSCKEQIKVMGPDGSKN